MPDAAGNFRSAGWSAAKAASWERIFSSAPVPPPEDDGRCNRRDCWCQVLSREELIVDGLA